MAIVVIPDNVTAADLERLSLGGGSGVNYISRTRLEWTLNGNTATLVIDFPAKTIELTNETAEQVTILEASLVAIGQPPQWAAVYDIVIDRLQGYVGRSIADLEGLTTDQKANVAILLLLAVLHDKKAFNADGELRPLREWIKRRLPDVE